VCVSGCASSHLHEQSKQCSPRTPESIDTSQIQFSACPPEKLTVSSICWKEPFGYRKEDTNCIYLLMTQGIFLTPQTTNFTTLIHSWLVTHTNADATVIYTMAPVYVNNPDSKTKSIWITDGNDCLNVYLVRNGSCPAFTMLLNPGDKTPLTQNQYEETAKKIIEAEALANKDGLGIWKETPLK
jgi:hypothetical protein